MNLQNYFTVIRDPFLAVSAALRIGVTLFIAVTLLAWLMNIVGAKGLNFGLLFAVTLAATLAVTKSVVFGSWLALKAVSSSTADKVKDIAITVVYNTMLVVFFLAVWDFSARPATFFPFAAAMLMLLMWQLNYATKAKSAKVIQFWVFVVVAGLALLQSTGLDVKSEAQKATTTSALPSAGGMATVREIEVPREGIFFELRPGEEVVLNLRNIPEGIKRDLFRPTDKANDPLAFYTAGDFAVPVGGTDGNYFYQGGELKIRLRAVDETFAKAGVSSVRMQAFSNRLPD